jgi:hypothetical protein
MPRIVRVSDVKANLLRPATTSHFEVEIPLIDALARKWDTSKQGKINLMCCEASLPGSNLATFDVNNDRTGVTEKRVHRRIFDDRIDLSFYVDAGLYQPIKFFEQWMSYITNGRLISDPDQEKQLMQPSYDYRMRYPDSYIADQGLRVTKFERDHLNPLTYEFVNSFPLSISSMPVSYDGSSLLKCTVSMSYIRYVIRDLYRKSAYPSTNPFQMSQFNAAGFLGNLGGGLVDNVVDRVTGSDLFGDIAGGFANQAIRDAF